MSNPALKTFRLSDVVWQGRFTHQKAILFNEDDLDAKGSKIQVIKIHPHGAIDPHYHQIRTEVFLVLKGSGIITLDDQEIQSKESDFLLCQPNTVHAFKNTSEEDFIVAVVRTNDPGDTDMHWVKDNA